MAMEHIATATIFLQDRIRDRAAGGCGGGSGICDREVGGAGVSMRESLELSSRCDIMSDGPAIMQRLSCCVNSGDD